MRAGQRPITDAISIDIEVATELFDFVKIFPAQDLAPVVPAAVVPGQRIRQVLVHSELKIGEDDDRRLQSVG